ncbi:MAG: pyridoxamine 5'-phosphate oxidase family protein [Pseudomonadota bacterium]
MSDPSLAAQFAFARSLDATLDTVWQALARGVGDRRAPERHPTLATVGTDDTPQMRTVVLRAADRTASTLDIHTDVQSRKVAELARQPRCMLHVWNPKLKLQMRIAADAKTLTGDAVAPIWSRVPDASRYAYGGTPYPGQPIDAPEDFMSEVDVNRFAVLRMTLTSIETLCLAPDRHYRAVFSAADNWAGGWVAP